MENTRTREIDELLLIMKKLFFLAVLCLFAQQLFSSEENNNGSSYLSCPVYGEIARIATQCYLVKDDFESMKQFITPYFEEKKCLPAIKSCLVSAKFWYYQGQNFQYSLDKIVLVQKLNDFLLYVSNPSTSLVQRQLTLIVMYHGLFLYCNKWR
jgi:hypothetical protein